MATVGHGERHGLGGDRHGDVLPWLSAMIVVGVILGAATAKTFAELTPSGNSLFTRMILGSAIGAIMGLFVGLSRAIERPREPLRTSLDEPRPESEPSPPDLWDPWLDNDRDAYGIDVESEATITQEVPSPAPVEGFFGSGTERARVRPRVISRQTGEAIPLEDEIGPLIQSGQRGLFVILGGPGSGKSTALRHLAAILPPWACDRVQLVEDLDRDPVSMAFEVTGRLVILFTDCFPAKTADQVLVQALSQLSSCHFVVHRLASWSNDDLIEYLLAAHRDRCGSVMSRLKTSGDISFLKGNPELCVLVLNEMALDESVGDVRTAMRHALARRFDDLPVLRQHLEDVWLTAIGTSSDETLDRALSELSGQGITGDTRAVDLVRLVRHRSIGLVLAADRITAILEEGTVSMSLAH